MTVLLEERLTSAVDHRSRLRFLREFPFQREQLVVDPYTPAVTVSMLAQQYSEDTNPETGVLYVPCWALWLFYTLANSDGYQAAGVADVVQLVERLPEERKREVVEAIIACVVIFADAGPWLALNATHAILTAEGTVR